MMKTSLALLVALFFVGTQAISRGERCDPADDKCDAPLSCVGNSPNTRCFMKKPIGMKCGKDPFWVCEDGLECCDGRCFAVGSKGERCGKFIKCPPPLSCVGLKKNLRCFEKKPEGMRCGKDPFWVCKDGLACVEGICKKGAGIGESCGMGVPCGAPLSCEGPSHDMRCFLKKALLERCGENPYSTCEGKLVCDNTCKIPRRLGKKCRSKKHGCKAGLICLDGVCQEEDVTVASPEATM